MQFPFVSASDGTSDSDSRFVITSGQQLPKVRKVVEDAPLVEKVIVLDDVEDLRENELDGVGSWFDYLTDCLGFRVLVEYNNSYLRIDGYERKEDWSVGFYIYLRAFGAESSNIFR